MREKLNSNPLYQVAVIGLLLIGAGVFAMSATRGGSEEEVASEAAPLTTEAAPVESLGAPEGTAIATSLPTADAPPAPRPVREAFAAGKTVAILFVHPSGIDDRLVVDSVAHLAAVPGVAAFVVPADQIARYASVALGVAVNRVPALVVLRPQQLSDGAPEASVSYGFQSPANVVQAVIDANYEGRTIEYHP